MKLKSTPGRVVQKRTRFNGKKRIKPWFRFYENGIAEIDETKVSLVDLAKLKRLFAVVEDKKDYSNMEYTELQKEYVSRFGKSAVGVSKKTILKELGA